MANEIRRDLIDRNALIEKKRHYCCGHGEYDYMVELWHIEHAPTVDAVEVVHGRWIMDKLEIGNPYDGNGTMLVDIGNCSVCGYRCEMLPIMNYCPNCGAKMDGDGNG